MNRWNNETEIDISCDLTDKNLNDWMYDSRNQ